MESKFKIIPTLLGEFTVWWTDKGLCKLSLPDKKRPARQQESSVIPIFILQLEQKLKSFAKGEPVDFQSIPLDFKKSSFQAQVYKALQKIAPGQILTYQELAEKVGSPGAARAVGSAMSKNPVPIVIPCHRVLPKTGKTVGFYSGYGGTKTKEKLLRLEKAELPF